MDWGNNVILHNKVYAAVTMQDTGVSSTHPISIVMESKRSKPYARSLLAASAGVLIPLATLADVRRDPFPFLLRLRCASGTDFRHGLGFHDDVRNRK